VSVQASSLIALSPGVANVLSRTIPFCLVSTAYRFEACFDWVSPNMLLHHITLQHTGMPAAFGGFAKDTSSNSIYARMAPR
jgi:hypothetical protein